MDTKKLSKDTATADSEEVVGILMAISVVAKRLARNIAESEPNTNAKGGNENDKKTLSACSK